MKEPNSYNLTDEPWIPVILDDGGNRLVSLREVFSDNENRIADLACNPVERIAVFRLLLCLTQASFGEHGIESRGDWKKCREEISSVGMKYLDKWHHKFFLYGHSAFLQPDCVEAIVCKKKNRTTRCDKLIPWLASGNNHVLYDHEAITGRRVLPDHEKAMGILIAMCFGAEGKISPVLWNGEKTLDKASAAPCRQQNALYTILTGDSLLDTLWMNLNHLERIESQGMEFGRPFWEFDELSRSEEVEKNKRTFLGRLMPFSRAIKLVPGENQMIYGQALIYDKCADGVVDSMATALPADKSKDDAGKKLLSATIEMMPWRNLSSILAADNGNGRKDCALAVKNDVFPGKKIGIWTGELQTSQAKNCAVLEWRLGDLSGLLCDETMQDYRKGVRIAEECANRLENACEEYANYLKKACEEYSSKSKKNSSPFAALAKDKYWWSLNQSSGEMLLSRLNSEDCLTEWKRECEKQMRSAYRDACPHITSRQLVAHVANMP